MGCTSSTQVKMRELVEASVNEFVEAHCIVGEDETTDADLFMEAFARFLFKQNGNIFASNFGTTTWMAQIIQETYPKLRFVGNNPRLSKVPFTYEYIFNPTTVIGVRVKNLSTLWSQDLGVRPKASHATQHEDTRPPKCF